MRCDEMRQPQPYLPIRTADLNHPRTSEIIRDHPRQSGHTFQFASPTETGRTFRSVATFQLRSVCMLR